MFLNSLPLPALFTLKALRSRHSAASTIKCTRWLSGSRTHVY
jgi:hypothetical protein